MRINISFRPYELEAVESLIKRMREVHPSLKYELDTSKREGKSSKANYHYILHDGR